MKNFGILAVASLGPALPILFLDPGFGWMMAPGFWVMTAALSITAWFLLALFRCPKNARLIVIVAGSCVLTFWQGLSAWHAQSAMGRLERLLIRPLPASIEPLHSEAAIGMAGGYELVAFSVAPDDLQSLILSRRFAPINFPGHDPELEGGQVEATLKKLQIKAGSAYHSGDYTDELFLIANPERDKVLLYRSRL